MASPMSRVNSLVSADIGNYLTNKETWSSILYNVKSYGAEGDGTTDDTADIQSAIDAAFAAGGGNVFFPAGRYIVNSSLVLKTNVIMSGVGRHVSIIVGSTASMVIVSMVQSTLTRTYNEIYSLGFEGGAASVTGIKSVLASALRFEDLYFAGCLYNFNLDRGSNIQMEGILVEGTLTIPAGKSLFQDTTKADYLYDLQITDYQIRNIGNGVQDPSIEFNRCVGSILTGYHVNDLFAGSAASGVLYSGDCQGCKMNESIIVKPNAYGVKYVIEGATYPIAMEVSNVDIDQSQLNGIQIDAGFWYTITGGNITDCLQHGIILSSNNVTIEGIKIIDCASQGIQINANVTNFIIDGNHIEQCSTAVLIAAGTSNNYIIRNNDLSVLNTNKIIDNGTGTSKLIGDNLGINDSFVNEFTTSTVKTLTGGAASETVTIAITAGLFSAKPQIGYMMEATPSQFLIGYYDFDNVGNTSTLAFFTIVRRDGGVIGAGGHRLSVLLKS